jgi:signal transduction histidine kinase
MDVEWIAKKINPDTVVSNKITDMISLIDQTVVAIRRIVSELRPGVLDDLGLIAALEWQCKEFERRTGIKCSSDIRLDDTRLGKHLSINLFRIYQEALTNIARHSKATRVTTVIKEVNGYFNISVKDNGIGFDRNASNAGNSWGLAGMRERVGIFEGELHMQTAPGKGTEILIKIPIQNAVL